MNTTKITQETCILNSLEDSDSQKMPIFFLSDDIEHMKSQYVVHICIQTYLMFSNFL